MASTDFSELYETMKAGVIDLAKAHAEQYVSQATADGHGVLTSMKADMENWAAGIVRGEMGQEDLKFLIEGRRELTQMRIIKQAGLAQIQIEKFRNGFVELVVGTICKTI